jgi:hypothetical protein
MGFQHLLILDLWGISFHAVVVFGLGKNLLFKSILGLCEGFMNSEQINLFAHSYTISLIFRLMWEGEISYQMSIVMAVKSD